jgi:hypothetical protein
VVTLQQHKEVAMLCEEGMIIVEARSALLVEYKTSSITKNTK